MNRKDLMGWILIIFVCFLPGVVQGYAEGEYGAADWSLFLDGINLQPDVLPAMTDEGMLMPIRFIIEGMGGEVQWISDTKEVNAIINNKKLYIHFTANRANSIKLNGKDIEVKPSQRPTLISGRTMVGNDIVEAITGKHVSSSDKIYLISVNDNDKNDIMLEGFLNLVNDADQYLDLVFRTHRNNTKQQLEQSLQKYYSYEISEMIIEHYYNKNIDGTYTALPTEKPISLLPLGQIEQIRLDSVVREGVPRQILSVYRKPTLFNAYEVHSLYQFRQINRQWIIVEIIHHLVDNSTKVTERNGGIPL